MQSEITIFTPARLTFIPDSIPDGGLSSGPRTRLTQFAGRVQSSTRLDTAIELIGTIDLRMVKHKLMDPEEGQGWNMEAVDEVEKRYRRYLVMLYLDRDGWVPTRDIDAMWHQHILDTRAYASDCMRVFGEFIHHFPYFGMRGEADANHLAQSFTETCEFYHELFNENYSADGKVAGKCCRKCGRTSRCYHV